MPKRPQNADSNPFGIDHGSCDGVVANERDQDTHVFHSTYTVWVQTWDGRGYIWSILLCVCSVLMTQDGVAFGLSRMVSLP